jgi:repressor LexA
MTYTQIKPRQPIALTQKNLKAYEWIRTYMELSGGRSPSVREIMKGLKLKSPAPVQAHLRRLREAGYITWLDGQTRALKLTNEPGYVIPPANAAIVAAKLQALAKRSPIRIKSELLAIAQELQAS